MRTRVISGIIIFAVSVAIIILGGIPMYIFGATLSILALKEFYMAVGNKITIQNYLSVVFAIIFFVLTYIDNLGLMLIAGIVYMLMNFIYLLGEHHDIKLEDFFANVFGFIYIVPAFMVMAVIRENAYGAALLLLVFLSSAATDTFAYFIGKAIGKHKLAPVLSPNKTIEGSIGGTVISAIIFVSFTQFINSYANFYTLNLKNFLIILIIGIVSAIVSQLGDLSASAIKRITGVKDYGHLIPGHGGVLDRMDSALFTAPALYVVLYLFVY